MKSYKLSQLVQDFDLYPRGQVDSQHAGYIASAIRGGAEMPPLVICRHTKRIIDGFHRWSAYRKLYGLDHKVECVEKSYKSDADRLADAIRYNAAHGRALTKYDRCRCIILAETHGLTDEQLSELLHVTPDEIGEMRVKSTAKSPEDVKVSVPLKRTLRKQFAGKQLSQREADTNKRSSGMQPLFYMNQLIDLLEINAIDFSDEGVTERAKVLQGLLESQLATA